MDSPFNLSDDRLQQLLASYKGWLDRNPDAANGIDAVRNRDTKLESTLLNLQFVEAASEDSFYQEIYDYSRTLDGPAYINLGEPRIRNNIEQLRRNLLYLLSSDDRPFEKAGRILDGDYKIQYFSTAFWTPLFKAHYPDTLPNWNNKTEDFMRQMGVDLPASRSGAIEAYRTLSEAFSYLRQLAPDLDFYALDHLMHYGVAVNEGQYLLAFLTSNFDALVRSGSLNRYIDDYLATRHSGSSERWDEAYKWDTLSKVHAELTSSEITPENVASKVDLFQTHNPPVGSFVHWSSLADLKELAEAHPEVVAEQLNQLFAGDEPVHSRIANFRSVLRDLKRDAKLGTPLYGYLLAAWNYESYPLYKDGVYQKARKLLEQADAWPSGSPLGVKYAIFRELCLAMGRYLGESGALRTVEVDDTLVETGVTALDGQDFFYWIYRNAGDEQPTPVELAEIIEAGEANEKVLPVTSSFLNLIAGRIQAELGDIDADIGRRAPSEAQRLQFVDRAYFWITRDLPTGDGSSTQSLELAVFLFPSYLWWGLHTWGSVASSHRIRDAFEELGLIEQLDGEVKVNTGNLGGTGAWTSGAYFAVGHSMTPDEVAGQPNIGALAERIASDLIQQYGVVVERLDDVRWRLLDTAAASDRQSPTAARELIEKLLPDGGFRRTCLQIFANSIAQAHQSGDGIWGVTLHSDRVRLNVGRFVVATLHRGALWLVFDTKHVSAEAEALLRRQSSWERPYVGLPNAAAVKLTPDNQREIAPLVEAAHSWLIEEAAASVSVLPKHMRSAHSPAVLVYLEHALGMDIPEPAYSTLHFWWVNQGSSYDAERQGGYLWAPTRTKDGRQLSHWTNLTRLQPGDIVLHYANGAIRAASQVKAAATEAPRPEELSGADWEQEGYLVQVNQRPLAESIPLEDIPLEWRIDGIGPFTVHGSVKQGYLFPLAPEFIRRLIWELPHEWPEFATTQVSPPPDDDYIEPPFAKIQECVDHHGLRLADDTLRRYHLALKTRGFVILSGVSGTGKTWLTRAYADAVGAEYLLVPVAPNWTTNEDLLGYHNPIDNHYYDTPFSRFLRRAAKAYEEATERGRVPRPFHLTLDEMNLARVEYYFAKFLSAMETRARAGTAMIELGPGDPVLLPPTLYFVGTVNIDETTHDFADKVYDRAQLIELEVSRDALAQHLGDVAYRETVLDFWDAVHEVAPFAFRIIDEMKAYVAAAESLDVKWETALDEQLLHKVLPKLKGADPQLGQVLDHVVRLTEERFTRSYEKAKRMQEDFRRHGFASYF